jgi:hypothetical protein
MGNYYYTATTWLEHHMLACPFKMFLGIDCPGCGMQRSAIALLRGDVVASWRVYPPGIFIFTTLIFLVLHLFFNFRQGAFILKLLYIVSSTAIVINYVHKILTNQLY